MKRKTGKGDECYVWKSNSKPEVSCCNESNSRDKQIMGKLEIAGRDKLASLSAVYLAPIP